MTHLKNTLSNIIRDEEGASLAEYGLLLGLIAVAAISGLSLMGSELRNTFSNTAQRIRF